MAVTSSSADAIMGLGLLEVVRQMPDVLVIAEAPSGKLLFANERARALAARRRGGRTEPDLGDEKLRLFYPDGRRYQKDDWPILRSARDGEEIADEEYFQLAADGTRMWLRASCAPVRDADGRVVAAVAVARDITEQKRAEDELRYHASLVENMEDAVIATDARFLVRAWNRGAEGLYGWTADEALGSDVRTIGRSDVGDAQRAEALRKLLESGRARVELTASRKDGTRVDVEVVHVAIPGERGDLTGVLGIHRDITERKRAEEALREAQRRSETILESIADAFVAVDREWRYTYVNERALRRMERRSGRRLTREEVLGHDMWELFPDARGTEVYAKYHEAMREQRPVEFETYFAPSDEWIEAHAFPSEHGLSIYYRNVSARKRAEQEREARARQQELVAELGLRALATDDLQRLMDEAVSLVARTLDVDLVGIAEVLPGRETALLRAGVGWNEGAVGHRISDDLASDRRFEDSPLLSEHDAVSGASVVIAGRHEPFGSLRAFSRRGRAFTEHDVNVMQTVANVLAAAVERSEAQERLTEAREVERRRIARDLHDEPLRDLTEALVMAGGAGFGSDESDAASRLAAVIPALKHVGEQLRGAIYDLRLGGAEDRPFPELLEALVDVHRAMALDCEVELEVRDGVPADPLGATGTEMLRVLREALTNARRHSNASHVRVSVWRSEDTLCAEVSDDGRGFDPAGTPAAVNRSGIRGMRERVGLLDGELDIRSRAEVGTTVQIEVLLNDGEEPTDEIRVLLVEDHASVRQAIASAFEREPGFRVVGEAASLAEAREMLDDVDVAVLDLGLPDGDGADLVKDLRAVNRRAHALVLSASFDRAEIARAVQSGAAGVLNKTADLDELVDAVRRVRAGEMLLPMDEIVELLSFAGHQREREHDERQALATVTPREREILQAMAEGLDSQRMADRLHISIRTARNHINNILAKLGVHSQLQALVLAVRYEVVRIPRAHVPPAE